MKRATTGRWILLPVLMLLGCSAKSAAPSHGDITGAGGHEGIPPDGGSDAGSPLPDGPVELPRGAPGIEFDDIQFGASLGKVIVPAGRTGSVDLIDQDSSTVTELTGLSASDSYTVVPATVALRVGTRYGSTSATEAGRYVVALDATAQTLNVLDPATAQLVASAPLGGPSDYVHYVASAREIWVTNPYTANLDVYSLPESDPPTPSKVGSFPIPGGPESLVIDETRHRAYTNAFVGGQTFAVDLASHAVVETWTNGCGLALGVSLDEPRGFAFVACGESGDVVSLDVAHGGATVGRQRGGDANNILAYSSRLEHLYSASGNTSELSIMAVSPSGELSILGTVPTADRAFSVAADDRGHAWVIDPDHGQVLRITDPFPKGGG